MLHRSFVLMACVCLTGCLGSHPGNMPPAASPGTISSNDVIRAGDKLTVRLTGVPDGEYVIEVQVPSSGDITVPLLTHAFHATGRNAADIATEITNAYKNDKIYTNPHVTVLPQERYINVGGDVRSPARVIYTPDSTLMSTINSCGGFSEYADRHHVSIIRGQQTYQVDCVNAERTSGADPAVYPGDQIFVPRTPF